MGREITETAIADLISDGALLINDGYRAKNVELSVQGIPFARAANIDKGFWFEGADYFPEKDLDRVGEKVSHPGDVVFTSKGTVGRFAFVNEDTPRFVYSPQLCFWRSLDHERLDPKWLFYWMQSNEFREQYEAVSGQTDMAAYVNLRDQRSMRILIPDPETQCAIAHVLGTLDAKIDLNRRMNETLEAIARAMFKSWFVDFDPVHAKADGRDTVLPPHVAKLFPDRFEGSELGPIPAGWRVGSLADFAVLNPESWAKDTRPDVIHYVDLSNTKWGTIEAVAVHSREDAPSRAQRVLKPGDTIVGTVRPGNGSYALITQDGLTGSTGFAVLRPRRPEYQQFVYMAATATENIQALAQLADGAAYPAVRPDVVISTSVVCPSESAVARWAKAIEPLLLRLAQNERESGTLADLRDALLPKLISGEIGVSGDFARETES